MKRFTWMGHTREGVKDSSRVALITCPSLIVPPKRLSLFLCSSVKTETTVMSQAIEGSTRFKELATEGAVTQRGVMVKGYVTSESTRGTVLHPDLLSLISAGHQGELGWKGGWGGEGRGITVCLH